VIVQLARRLQVRQQAVATAAAFLSRFYTKSVAQNLLYLFTRASLSETNPYMILSSCLYLACKVEECPQHIRTIVSEARALWPGKYPMYEI
jgi:cyclin C